MSQLVDIPRGIAVSPARRRVSIKPAVRAALEALRAGIERGDAVSPYVTVNATRAAQTLGAWCVQAELQRGLLTNYIAEGAVLYIECQPGKKPAIETSWETQADIVSFGKAGRAATVWVVFSAQKGICLAGAINLGVGKWMLFRMLLDKDTQSFVHDKTWCNNRKKHEQARRNGHRTTRARRNRKKRNGRWKVNNLQRKTRNKRRSELGIS